jgi:hypothetical protein
LTALNVGGAFLLRISVLLDGEAYKALTRPAGPKDNVMSVGDFSNKVLILKFEYIISGGG